MSKGSVIEMKRKLLMVVNVDWFLISHRLPIALAALEEGYDVHLACRFTGQQDWVDKELSRRAYRAEFIKENTGFDEVLKAGTDVEVEPIAPISKEKLCQ